MTKNNKDLLIIDDAMKAAPNGAVFSRMRLESVTFTKEELLAFAKGLQQEVHNDYLNKLRFTVRVAHKGKELATQQFDLNVSNGDSLVLHLDNIGVLSDVSHIDSNVSVLAEYTKQQTSDGLTLQDKCRGDKP